jgi:hypothetical protein
VVLYALVNTVSGIVRELPEETAIEVEGGAGDEPRGTRPGWHEGWLLMYHLGWED